MNYDKIKKIYDDYDKIKDGFNEKSYYFSLKSIFVGYIDDNLCFKYVIRHKRKYNDFIITMYINDNVTIKENRETDIYNSKHNDIYYEGEEIDDSGEEIFIKPIYECNLYSNFDGIFNDFYCSSGEGYELCLKNGVLCSYLHAFKIIHIDILSKRIDCMN